jgi:MoaA/NifB/PqqE/SkfB family radical SAM enzyme
MKSNTFHRAGLFMGALGSVVRSRFLTHRPCFLSHLLTTRCFAKCATCLWRGKSAEERDTAKIIDFYRQAKELGFISTTFWGGEPLLRRDLFDILHACRRFGLITGLITNGHLLPKHHQALAANLDFLIVSVDMPNAEHDRLRGVPGMFDNIVKGLDLVRAENPRLKVFVNSVVSQLNHAEIEQLVRFAEDHKTSITFESVNQGEVEFPRNDGTTVVDLRLRPEDERAVFHKIRQMRKRHPAINNSKGFLRLIESGRVEYRCRSPRLWMRVEPDGSVNNCQDRAHPIGNVYRQRLADIVSSPAMKRLQRQAESCSRCRDSGVIESSLFWDFHLEVIANNLRLFVK